MARLLATRRLLSQMTVAKNFEIERITIPYSSSWLMSAFENLADDDDER